MGRIVKRKVYVVVRWSDNSLFNIEGVFKHQGEAFGYCAVANDPRLRVVESNLCRQEFRVAV